MHGSIGLIQEGLIWRVENGNEIHIWDDRWIPKGSTFKIQPPPKILDRNATVNQLIDADRKWCNVHLLNQVLVLEEVEVIQSIPINNTNQEDTLIWKETGTGLFSVNSAYHLQKSIVMDQMAEGSSCNQVSDIWRYIWSLNIPNGDKNFFWRPCNDSLLTRDYLCRRKVINDPRCPICENEVETTFHILWQCQSAKDVWTVGSSTFQKSAFEGPGFLQVVEGMMRRCAEHDYKKFVGIARFI
jgi:hypothetical protein